MSTILNNLYLVGLPATHDTASAEFLNFLALPTTTIGLTSFIAMTPTQMNQINAGEKIKVTPQWDFLINDGYKFTTSDSDIKADEKIVYMKNRQGSSSVVAQQIIDEYNVLNAKYPTSKIAFVTTTSPNLWNGVAQILISQVPPENVVNNENAPNIAYELLLDFGLIPDEPLNITTPFDLSIQPTKVNMVGLLGSYFKGDLTEFKRIIGENPDASIYRVILSYRNEIDELTSAELLGQLETDRSSFNTALISVVLKN